MAYKQYNTLTRAETGTSDWIIVNPKVEPFILAVTGDISSGGSMTYTVEYTIDDLSDETDTSGTALDLPNFAGLTATATKAVVAPIKAVRVNITSYSSGTFTLKVRQAGVKND